jgi:signal peptidase
MIRSLALRRPWRLTIGDWAVNGILAATAVLLVAALVAWLSGFEPLVERSGSMRPLLAPGDLLISQTVSPAQLHAGDVVSFVDPTRHDELVTHRVVSIQRTGQELKFVTRGDANAAPESWTAASTGHLRRMVAHVPLLGYASAWLSWQPLRLALIYLASASLAVLALRRIWRGR